MRPISLSIWFLATLGAASARGDEYSWELVGGLRSSDVASSADAEGASFSATYHFRPVDDSAGPYSLAAFLSHSSRVGATYGENKTTSVTPVLVLGPVPVEAPTSVTVVDRAASRSLAGRYVWEASGWFAGAAYAVADAADPAPLPSSFSVLGDDFHTRAVTVGKYVRATTAVELSLEKAEASLTASLPLFCTAGLCSLTPRSVFTSTLDTDSDSVSISAQHVGDLGRLKYALAGGVASNQTASRTRNVEIPVVPPPPVAFPQTPFGPALGGNLLVVGVVGAGGFVPSTRESKSRRERYSLSGELFPTKALGIRLGYARWDGRETLDERYELAASWFFKPGIGARVAFAKTRTDLPVVTVQDVDDVSLQLIGRL
jgi:hypothetical protein